MDKKKQQTAIDAIHAAADKQVPQLKAAFLAAIEELKNTFDSKAVEAALSQNNIDAVLAAMQMDKLDDLLFGIGMNPNAYILTDQLRGLFAVGASVAMFNLPLDIQKALAFDSLGERAVRKMREDGLIMARELTESTKAGVRTLLADIMATGEGPVKQARQIRSFIGLTESQTKAVLNFRRQLEARKTFGLTPPDERRLDAIEQAMVRRHMSSGIFDQQKIDEMVETYYQRLLNKRALDIARTESLNAVNNGQIELWEQGWDQGLFSDETERMFWIVTRDDRLRETHAAIPAMNPYGVKIGQYFITPFGAVRGPGDRNSGLINCRCVVVLGFVGQTYSTEGYIQ